MNFFGRVVVVATGIIFSLAASGLPASDRALVVGAISVFVMVGGMLAAGQGWKRPGSDLIAWTGAIAFLAAMPNPQTSPVSMSEAALGVTLVAVAVHLPVADAPAAQPRSGSLSWGLAAFAVFLVAWGPSLILQDRVERMDPIAPSGMAIRTAFILGAVAMVLLVAAFLRRLLQRRLAGDA